MLHSFFIRDILEHVLTERDGQTTSNEKIF